jgi:TldD protein
MTTLSPREVRRILDEALSLGGTFAEIFLENSFHTQLALEDGSIERVSSGQTGGAGLRVERRETIHFASTNEASPEALAALARSVARGVGAKREISCPDLARRSLASPSPVEVQPEEISLEAKAEVVREAERGARERDARVRQVRATYLDHAQDVLVANSDGVWDTDRRVRTTLFVEAVARDGQRMFTGFQSAGGTVGFELFKQESPFEVGREAARIAVLQLEGAPAPAGEMAVVLGASAGGVMIHEACGHGLEGDLVMSGVSIYAGRVGEQVASPLVTVVDDGTLPNARGTEKMDDEGSATRKVVLIERGALKGFLHSLKTARALSMPPTGNGRRQGFRNLPIPRMRNTYVARGETHPRDIVASVKDGLYVAKMGGGQVDVVSGHFVFHVSEGYLIRDGRLDRPVRGATLTGCGPEILKSVDMVGSDFGFGIGTCGKDGQWVPVSNAQPTLRIPKMVVGGVA